MDNKNDYPSDELNNLAKSIRDARKDRVEIGRKVALKVVALLEDALDLVEDYDLGATRLSQALGEEKERREGTLDTDKVSRAIMRAKTIIKDEMRGLDEPPGC